jgi:hypothetical protein
MLLYNNISDDGLVYHGGWHIEKFKIISFFFVILWKFELNFVTQLTLEIYKRYNEWMVLHSN